MEKYSTEKEINELENLIETEDFSEYFFEESVYDNFLYNFMKNDIRLTPCVGRVKKSADNIDEFTLYKENLFNKVDTVEYRKKIKEKVLKIIGKVNYENFKDFCTKYKSKKYDKIVTNAMKIKYDNPNYLNDIGEFLYKNGISLFVEKYPSEDWENLDGFSCFYNEYPMIVIYEQKDKRRMLFTIMHELYHLMYDENEKLADKFASAALITSKDLEKFKTSYKKEDLGNYFNIIKEICKNNYISTTAAIKALKREKIFLEQENYYTEILSEEMKKIREALNNEDNSKINIKSIEKVLYKI